MGYELDSQVMQRLQENYRGMSDGELLELAAKPEDLTDIAQQALRNEMAVRKLKVEASQPEPGRRWASDALDTTGSFARSGISGSIMGSSPVMELAAAPDAGVGSGEVSLTVFYDALEAGEACDCLEAAQVPFRVHDLSEPQSGMRSFDSSPPVALSLIVAKADKERAMAVLREKMGLFPLQEVEEADPVIDDGTVGVLGSFGRREDAAEFEKALDDARIWHRMVANPDGSPQTEDAWTLEVREVDLMKAGDVVEKAMG